MATAPTVGGPSYTETTRLLRPAAALFGAIPFEYLLFGFAMGGMALGAAAIVLGLLGSPAASMVVGDWYLLTSGFIIVAAASSRRPAILLAAAAVALVAATLYLPIHVVAPAVGLKSYVKVSVALAAAAAIATQFAIGLRRGGTLRANRDLAIACFAVALVVTPLMSGWGIQISALIPQTLDATALRVDEAFGLRAPAWLDGKIGQSAALSYIVFHVYISISLAMVGYDLMFGDTQKWRMTKLLLLSSLLGFLTYFITPVVGTVYFSDYGPSAPFATIVAQTASSDLPRNAMPSLHTTWGLMLIVSAALRPRAGVWNALLRASFAVYGVLTICGALTFGKHYLIDCVVALPFAATIMLAFAQVEARGTRSFAICIAAGLALFVGWIAILRIGGGLAAQPVILAMTAASLAHMVLSVRAMRTAPRWT